MKVEIVEVAEKSEPTVRYFKQIEIKPVSPPNWFGNVQEFGREYQGFVIVQPDPQFTFFEIKNRDLSNPPIPLRGSFTVRQRAMDCIDKFLRDEEQRKKEKGK